jgi:hypothetical protein
VSWIVQILPQLDEANAYRKFDFKASAYAPENGEVRGHEIDVLLCPSQPDGPVPGIADTNYAGCHHHDEAQIAADNRGLMFLNSHMPFENVPDGMSHTLLIGEKAYRDDPIGWVSGTRATLRNTGDQINMAHNSRFGFSRPGTPPAAPPRPEDVGGFNSVHPGGAQFALGDGSVRFLSENTDPLLYTRLGDRADGELVKSP